MSMKNFRDESCRVCRVATKVNFVEVTNLGGLEVFEGPAPHTEAVTE